MSFLIFRIESAIDLRDFRSLVGVDASKTVRQIFLVGGTARPGVRFEHSAIALGRFNRNHIYQAAIQNGARVRVHRGIDLLEVDPFARDQPTFKDVRWLAVIGTDLAVFGTIANVREELDRYTDHIPADSSLLESIGRLRPDDETWCVMSDTVQKDGVRRALGSLDVRFLDLARDAYHFQFGIHYGRRVRLDYDSPAISPSNALASDGHKTVEQVLADAGMRSFVNAPGVKPDTHSVRGVLSIARARYEKWLSEL